MQSGLATLTVGSSHCLGMYQRNDPRRRKIHTLVLQYALDNLKQGNHPSSNMCVHKGFRGKDQRSYQGWLIPGDKEKK